MNNINQEDILNDVLDLMNKLARDWEYSEDINTDTYLFADLGFESIDAVVLSSFIQEHYQQQLPFPQLLAELGQREVKDLSVGELVSFVQQNTSSVAMSQSV